MRKSVTALAVAAAATLAIAGSAVAASGAYWNVTGTYGTKIMVDGDSTVYPETLVLVQVGTAITGSYLDYAGGCSKFSITGGSVLGIAINLAADNGCGNRITLSGAIASDGSMAGTWKDVAGLARTGTWATTSGAATFITANTHAKSALVPYPSGGAVGSVIFNSSSGDPNNLELTLQLKKVAPDTAYDVYLFLDTYASGQGVVVGGLTTNGAGNGTFHVNTYVTPGIHTVSIDVTLHGSGNDVYVTPGLYGQNLYLLFK